MIRTKFYCEFNQKILNTILSCNPFQHQCRLRPKKRYDYWQNTTENKEHLIVECDNVKQNLVKTVYDYEIIYCVETYNYRF